MPLILVERQKRWHPKTRLAGSDCDHQTVFADQQAEMDVTFAEDAESNAMRFIHIAQNA